jgi:hypothetical protein
MNRGTNWTTLALPFLLTACSAQPESLSPAPAPETRLLSAAKHAHAGDGHQTLCSADVYLAGDVSNPYGISFGYIGEAYTRSTACSIAGYFDDDWAKDRLQSYQQYQLIPWLQRFFGCPGPEPEGAVPTLFGLIPDHVPAYSVTPTDYYMIVTTFLTTMTLESCWQLTQEQLAQINLMLYELAPLVVNDFTSNASLTHEDCPVVYQPVDLLTACPPAP